VLRLNAPSVRYPEAEDAVRFYRRVVDEARALPGVRQAGLLRVLPLGETIGDFGIDVEGYDETSNGRAQADWQVVTEGPAEALGSGSCGRFLERGDDEKAPDVAVVNESMARRYWGDLDPVGRRFRIGSPQRPWVTVVGVVGDVRHNGIVSVVKAKFYRPHAQFHRSRGGATRDMALVLKTDGDPLALAAALRSVVRAIDPEVPVSRVRTMTEVVASSTASPRLGSVVLGLFASRLPVRGGRREGRRREGGGDRRAPRPRCPPSRVSGGPGRGSPRWGPPRDLLPAAAVASRSSAFSRGEAGDLATYATVALALPRWPFWPASPRAAGTRTDPPGPCGRLATSRDQNQAQRRNSSPDLRGADVARDSR
jgi:hypothetical protein